MQQMTVDRNSWHYKYNAYVYGSRRMERLSNGCPYFWRTVLACVFSPLIGAIYLTERIASVIPRVNIEMPKLSQETIEKIGKIILLGLFATAMILTGYGIGIGQWLYVLVFYISIGVVVGVIIGVVVLAIHIAEWHDNRPKKEPKEKQPNMVIQSLKAKKNRYCPKLVYTN